MASFLPDEFTSPSSVNMKRSLSESSTDNDSSSCSTLPGSANNKRSRNDSFKSEG